MLLIKAEDGWYLQLQRREIVLATCRANPFDSLPGKEYCEIRPVDVLRDDDYGTYECIGPIPHDTPTKDDPKASDASGEIAERRAQAILVAIVQAYVSGAKVY
ncbi:hypothetical protein KR51_00024170 [Rubidibacter lacunae KORDI 51-2]|uniref:Uncharacterized protein n=1 Tax=Rubidibacter lacunae KORDI 51-2 TaxID=582515 RepID=U5DJC2_9CHRO|nr:hypothetical protein [Rubidibacter lacunae]ERN41027.1 hypothetical protein KR51_00024170 [Rubidibacter lacunae KORDI 51-2]